MEVLNITEKTLPENAFEHKNKKPALSANRPSNNWAPVLNRGVLLYKLDSTAADSTQVIIIRIISLAAITKLSSVNTLKNYKIRGWEEAKYPSPFISFTLAMLTIFFSRRYANVIT